MQTRSKAPISIAALALFAACAEKAPVTTPPPVPPEPSATGKSAYSFVFDPSNPALGLSESVKFNRPAPRERLALPAYPVQALAAGDGPHREMVRIVIDTHGGVSEVNDSPLAASDGGPHAAEFRAAIGAAVRTWRFTPVALLKVEPGHDLDGDGESDYTVGTSMDVVSVYYDVKFTFEIVEGKGVVKRE